MATEKVICDTDVMIDYWNIRNERHNKTKALINDKIGIENIILSAVTKMELMIGAQNKSDLVQINKNLLRYNIASLDKEITGSAIKLIENYNLSHGLALPDSFIAATAIILKIPLFTYNFRDYRFIPDLNFI